MRKISVALTLIVFGFALAALPAQATSSDEEVFIASLAVPHGTATASGSKDEQAPPSFTEACSASATCNDGSKRTCSLSTSGTCTGVDANCASGQRGYVKCGSQATIYCPACPPTGCGYCTSNSYCNACCPTGFGTCSSGNCTCMF